MRKVGGVGVEVIHVATDSPPPDGQIEGDGALSGYGVAAGEMEIFLEVSGFGVDGSVEMTLIQVHIDAQRCDIRGGGLPSKFDGIEAVEAFKILDEGVRTETKRGKFI